MSAGVAIVDDALPGHLDLRPELPLKHWIDENASTPVSETPQDGNAGDNDMEVATTVSNGTEHCEEHPKEIQDDSLRFYALTKEEMAHIAHVKRALHSYHCYDPTYHDHAFFVRFLRCHEDVEVAIENIQKTMDWRHKVSISDLWKGSLSHGEDAFSKFHSHRFHGFDHQFHPVFFDRMGQADRANFFEHVEPEDVALRYARVIEQGTHLAAMASRMTHRHVDCITFVFDLNGMGYSDAVNKKVIAMFSTAVGLMQVCTSGDGDGDGDGDRDGDGDGDDGGEGDSDGDGDDGGYGDDEDFEVDCFCFHIGYVRWISI